MAARRAVRRICGATRSAPVLGWASWVRASASRAARRRRWGRTWRPPVGLPASAGRVGRPARRPGVGPGRRRTGGALHGPRPQAGVLLGQATSRVVGVRVGDDRRSSQHSSGTGIDDRGGVRPAACLDADNDLGQLCQHGRAFSPHQMYAARPGPVPRWQDCDETRQRQLAVNVLMRPPSLTGPVLAATDGQVRSKARGQSDEESRPLPPAAGPSLKDRPGQPHRCSSASV
jgi:hypothetical protein